MSRESATLTDVVQTALDVEALTRKLETGLGTGGTDADVVPVALTKKEIALILTAVEMAVGGASVS